MPKLRITVTHEYEADPNNYPNCDTAEDMAALDLANMKDDPYMVAELIAGGDFEVTLTPVQPIGSHEEESE